MMLFLRQIFIVLVTKVRRWIMQGHGMTPNCNWSNPILRVVWHTNGHHW